MKFGALRDHKRLFIGFDGRPAFVKASLAYTLQRLRTDYIDFYFPARVDSTVPIEETIGAIADLVREGKVLYAGLSEASAKSIRRAHAVHPIAALEIEYSLWSRDIEDEVLPAVRELGIGVLAYSALSRGLLTGAINSPRQLEPNDFRTHFPRFQSGNIEKNVELVEKLKDVASRRSATVPQLAIPWVLSRGRNIVPVVGTKRRARLEENLMAADMNLTPAEIDEIEAAVPRGAAAGARYPGPGMATLNG